MNMKICFIAAATAALMTATSASAVTEIDVTPAGPNPPGSSFVLVGPGNPFSGLDPLQAIISRDVSTGDNYIDNFLFRIGPANSARTGLGSGSITYTFSGAPDVIFNSVTFFNGIESFVVPINQFAGLGGGAITAGIGGIPIFSGVENRISVNWTTTGAAAYSGVIRFAPGAVPEPLTWAMMIIGFAAVGFSMRRRSKQDARVRYAY